jgi:hypothetical protein
MGNAQGTGGQANPTFQMPAGGPWGGRPKSQAGQMGSQGADMSMDMFTTPAAQQTPPGVTSPITPGQANPGFAGFPSPGGPPDPSPYGGVANVAVGKGDYHPDLPLDQSGSVARPRALAPEGTPTGFGAQGLRWQQHEQQQAQLRPLLERLRRGQFPSQRDPMYNPYQNFPNRGGGPQPWRGSPRGRNDQMMMSSWRPNSGWTNAPGQFVGNPRGGQQFPPGFPQPGGDFRSPPWQPRPGNRAPYNQGQLGRPAGYGTPGAWLHGGTPGSQQSPYGRVYGPGGQTFFDQMGGRAGMGGNLNPNVSGRWGRAANDIYAASQNPQGGNFLGRHGLGARQPFPNMGRGQMQGQAGGVPPWAQGQHRELRQRVLDAQYQGTRGQMPPQFGRNFGRGQFGNMPQWR